MYNVTEESLNVYNQNVYLYLNDDLLLRGSLNV